MSKTDDLPRWFPEGAIALRIRGVDVRGSDFNWSTRRWEPKAEPMPLPEDLVVLLPCTKCQQQKEPYEFYRRPEKYSGGRGRSYYCKDCSKASS